MNKMISKRMSAICALLENSDRVADVGCDHGYVAIELVRNKKTKRAICSDVRKAPLEKAKLHIQEALLDEYIECRLSDGLKNYEPSEVDAVIIAGMGGPLIQKILDESSQVVADIEQFILSPQSDIENFRRYLYNNKMNIETECIIKEDNKYYFIMKARHNTEKVKDLSDLEYKYGKGLLDKKDPILRDFLAYENRQLTALLKELEEKNVNERVQEVRELLLANMEAMKVYEVC